MVFRSNRGCPYTSRDTSRDANREITDLTWRSLALGGRSSTFVTTFVTTFADGGDGGDGWDGSDLTAVRAGAAGARLWTTTVNSGLSAGTDIVFDGTTMFVAGAARYAAEVRTGGWRRQYAPPGPPPSRFPMAAGAGHCRTPVGTSVIAPASARPSGDRAGHRPRSARRPGHDGLGRMPRPTGSSGISLITDLRVSRRT
ncbi:hypothetical protein ACIQGZ_20375 [Streptomyces sp. NPDC092296]|uniref:hypothetical protein n=1 Tax=Streptomyces sp. NPDC092296 TaxID=3366012 RepID=UPI0037F91DDA